MTQLIIDIPDDLNEQLRRAAKAKGSTLSEYVTQKLGKDMFWDTVKRVREQNRDADPAEIEADIEEAIRAVRVERRETCP